MAFNTTQVDHSWHPGAAMASEALADLSFSKAGEIVVELERASAPGVRELLAQDADYVVTVPNGASWGTVRALAAYPAGDLFHARRVTPRTQEEVFTPFALKAESVGRVADKAMQIDQEQDAEIDRALKVPRGEGGLDLPSAAIRAESVAGFDALGRVVAAFPIADIALAIANATAALVGATVAQAVVFLRAAAGAVARTVHAVMAERVSVADFGAVADCTGVQTGGLWGGTDNAPAFAAAIAYLEGRGGGVLHVPRGRYRVSAWPIQREGVVIVQGEGWTENPGLVSGASLPYPLNYDGTVIQFDRDVPGPLLQAHNAAADASLVPALPNNLKFLYRSARGSGYRDLMLIGGGKTGADITGLEARTVVRLVNVRIENFAGTGLKIDASTHTNSTPFGLADGSQLDYVVCRGNGRHGVWLRGNDANAITSLGLDCSLNGGCGLLDETQLGNTHQAAHFATNNQAPAGAVRAALEAQVPQLADLYTGAIVTTSPIGAHSFLGCYTEIGLGGKAHLVSPTLALGGNLAFTDALTATSTATVINGAGEIVRGLLRHVNRLGAKRISTVLGSDDGSLVHLGFGDLDADPGLLNRELELVFDDAADKSRYFQRARGPRLLGFFGSGSTMNAGIDAPYFPGGLFLGGPNAGYLQLIRSTAGAPASGTYARGTILTDRNAPPGAPPAYQVTTAGAIGSTAVVKPFANLGA